MIPFDLDLSKPFQLKSVVDELVLDFNVDLAVEHSSCCQHSTPFDVPTIPSQWAGYPAEIIQRGRAAEDVSQGQRELIIEV